MAASGGHGLLAKSPTLLIHRENTMTVIKQEDLIESVAAALQYISYYHPADYIEQIGRAHV